LSEDYLAGLARWACGVTTQSLPSEVVKRAGVVIADSIGVTVAGMQYPEMRAFAELRIAASPGGSASAVGMARKTDPSTAALLNGTAGTWMDMNEANLLARSHPGIQVIPIAFALAEQHRRSGADLVAAFVAGYEVSARIKRAANMRLAFHPHGTAGVTGAAVAVARLMGYDAKAMREIINVSATLGLATSRSAITNGATVRNIYTGMSGTNGLTAHELVQCGFTGEPDGMAPIWGKVYGDGFDPALAVRDLGKMYYLPLGAIKLHACGRYIHGPLDLTEDILAERPLAPERIRSIAVRSYAMAASLGGQEVASSFGARFSIPFAVASLIVHGEARLDNYELPAVENPRIRGLARKVTVTEVPEWTAEFPDKLIAEITITLDDGTQLTRRSDWHRGEARNPHPPEKIRAKFNALTAPVWGTARAEALYEQLLGIDRIADVSALGPAGGL